MDLVPLMNDVVISAQGDHQWSYCTGARGDDGDITAGTCSRYRICTVMYNVSAYVCCVNKTLKYSYKFYCNLSTGHDPKAAGTETSNSDGQRDWWHTGFSASQCWLA